MIDDNIKFLHMAVGTGAIPWYSQSEPMTFISITVNTGATADFFIFYNAPSNDNDHVVALLNITALPDNRYYIHYDIECDRGFTLSRAGSAGDVTMAYKGPTIILP